MALRVVRRLRPVANWPRGQLTGLRRSALDPDEWQLSLVRHLIRERHWIVSAEAGIAKTTLTNSAVQAIYRHVAQGVRCDVSPYLVDRVL